MIIDYQVIIDSLANIMQVATPIAVIMCLANRVIVLFCKFVGGKEVRF